MQAPEKLQRPPEVTNLLSKPVAIVLGKTPVSNLKSLSGSYEIPLHNHVDASSVIPQGEWAATGIRLLQHFRGPGDDSPACSVAGTLDTAHVLVVEAI